MRASHPLRNPTLIMNAPSLRILASLSPQRCFHYCILHPIWKLHFPWPRVTIFPYDNFSWLSWFCDWTPKGKLCPPLVHCCYFSLWQLFLDILLLWQNSKRETTPSFDQLLPLLCLVAFLWLLALSFFLSDCFCHTVSNFPPWQVGFPNCALLTWKAYFHIINLHNN